MGDAFPVKKGGCIKLIPSTVPMFCTTCHIREKNNPILLWCTQCFRCIINKEVKRSCPSEYCAAVYCSSKCQQLDAWNGHWLSCLGVKTDNTDKKASLTNQFRRYRLRQSYRDFDTLHLFSLCFLSKVISNFVTGCNMVGIPIDNEMFCQVINEKLKVLSPSSVPNEISSDNSLHDDQDNYSEDILESWTLVHAIFLYEKRYLHLPDFHCSTNNSTTSSSLPKIYSGVKQPSKVFDVGNLLGCVITLKLWHQLLQSVHRQSHSFVVSTPYHKYAQELPIVNEEEVSKTLSILKNAIDINLPDSILILTDKSICGGNILYNSVPDHYFTSRCPENLVGDQESIQSRLIRDRALMKLSQLADPNYSMQIINNNDTTAALDSEQAIKLKFDSLLLTGYIICLDLANYRHACNPNATIDVLTGENNEVCFKVIALRDIDVGEDVTLNYENNQQFIGTSNSSSNSSSSSSTSNKHTNIGNDNHHHHRNRSKHKISQSSTGTDAPPSCHCFKCAYEMNAQQVFEDFVQLTFNHQASSTNNSSNNNNSNSNSSNNDNNNNNNNSSNFTSIRNNNSSNDSRNSSISYIKNSTGVSSMTNSPWHFQFKQFRSLADLAMQQLNFTNAASLYLNLILCCCYGRGNSDKSLTNDDDDDDNDEMKNFLLSPMVVGDLYHALGAALLDSGSGNWRHAHRVWRLGQARVAVMNMNMSKRVTKISDSLPSSSSSFISSPLFTTHHHVFLTEACHKLNEYHEYSTQYSTTSSAAATDVATNATTAAAVATNATAVATTSTYSMNNESMISKSDITYDNNNGNYNKNDNSYYSILIPNIETSVSNVHKNHHHYHHHHRKPTICNHSLDYENTRSIHLSKTNIVSKNECQHIIQAAENYAMSTDGWTTSRHYSVPTTDLPIHSLPIDIRHWFNELIQTKIGPMMFQQYGKQVRNEKSLQIKKSILHTNITVRSDRNDDDNDEEEEENEKKRLLFKLAIHDAFVVKYQCHQKADHHDNSDDCDEEIPTPQPAPAPAQPQQRYLPVHIDQSTHSFVLPLNGLKEYTGGGTYFADLNDSIRPDVGQLCSFSGGSLYHGGDPLLSGTRYIIAAFLLLDCVEEEEEEQEDMTNNHRNDSIYQYSCSYKINATTTSVMDGQIIQQKNDDDDDEDEEVYLRSLFKIIGNNTSTCYIPVNNTTTTATIAITTTNDDDDDRINSMKNNNNGNSLLTSKSIHKKMKIDHPNEIQRPIGSTNDNRNSDSTDKMNFSFGFGF